MSQEIYDVMTIFRNAVAVLIWPANGVRAYDTSDKHLAKREIAFPGDGFVLLRTERNVLTSHYVTVSVRNGSQSEKLEQREAESIEGGWELYTCESKRPVAKLQKGRLQLLDGYSESALISLLRTTADEIDLIDQLSFDHTYHRPGIITRYNPEKLAA